MRFFKKQQGNLKFSWAIIALLIVIIVIVITIRFNAGLAIPLFLGLSTATFVAFFLGLRWKDIQQAMVNGITNSIIGVLILTLVGILVGIWIIGGTVPTLIYYGVQIISPRMFLPGSFLLCAITSLATGSSAGSIATMGIALMGIGAGMHIPAEIVAGTVTAGAILGDKMSPLSDTTNIASSITETDIFTHIGSMLWTTLPAAVISITIYALMGIKYSSGMVNISDLYIMRFILSANFNVSPITLIPIICLVVLSVKKVPALISLELSIVVSAITALVTQNIGFKAMLVAAMQGFKSTTGNAIVDRVLSTGGINMVSSVIIMILIATALGGVLEACGILNAIMKKILIYIKTARGIIISTLISCYVVIAVTGNMTLSLILPGRTFLPIYKEKKIKTSVLSRTLEDGGTLGSIIMPWGLIAIYSMGVLKVGIGFIPYSLLSFLVPIFTIFYAITGIAVWKDEDSGEKSVSNIVSTVND